LWDFNDKKKTYHNVHHEDYNSSYKTESNLQEDSDDPIIRARAKQLQKTLTGQIRMIEDT